MALEDAISQAGAPVSVLVVPANEELIVARETVAVVERARTGVAALVGQAS